MSKQKWIVFVVVLALTGSTAGFLNQLQSNHQLGSPGLKMSRLPVFDPEGKIVGTNTVDLPVSVLDYTSLPLPITNMEIDWLPKDTTYGRRRYVGPGHPRIDVSVVLMGTDRTSIHKPQICLTGQGWNIDKSEPLRLPVAQPHPYELPVMKLTASKQLGGSGETNQVYKAIYVYWFVSENRLTAQHGERMWWMAKDLITTSVLSRWAYVSYLSICLPGQEDEVFKHIRELIIASVPEFQLAAGPPITHQTSQAGSAVE